MSYVSKDADLQDNDLEGNEKSALEVEIELLREAMVQQGKRIGELEQQIDRLNQDLAAARMAGRLTYQKVKLIAGRLGISFDNGPKTPPSKQG